MHQVASYASDMYLDESIDDYIRSTLAKWHDIVIPANLIAPSRCIARRSLVRQSRNNHPARLP